MGVLEGRTAVVTGAARGIGRGVVELLVEHGAVVVLNDLDADEATSAASEIGGDIEVVAGDITDVSTADALVAEALRATGRVDIIVNNAGYTLDAPLHKMTDEAFQAMLDVHTLAPFRLLRAAAAHLREAARRDLADGREVFRKVVNVSSVAGTMGNAGQVNYAAAKAGVIGMTKALAKEWGPLRINVNAVAFGFIETRMTVPRTDRSVIELGTRSIRVGIPADLREEVTAMIPLGRPGSPRDAAGGVFFLCSPWSDYVHGQVLNVTGGLPYGMVA